MLQKCSRVSFKIYVSLLTPPLMLHFYNMDIQLQMTKVVKCYKLPVNLYVTLKVKIFLLLKRILKKGMEMEL